MSYPESVSTTFTAGGTLAKGQFVKLSSGEVIATAAIGDDTIGVVETDAVSGDLVSVITSGPADVLVSAALTKGTEIESDANGRAQAVTTGVIVGRILEVGAAAVDSTYALAKADIYGKKIA